MSAFSAPPPRPGPAPREKICVFFASGTLGKQVVRGLIERGELDARCCVRNAKDPAVVALKNMGGEVIEVNLDDRDSIRQAMRGCSGAYLAQNSLATSEEQEIRQAKLVTQVAKEAGIGINTHFGLLVHITLPTPDHETSNEIINRKAAIDSYLASCESPWCAVEMGIFFDHFLPGGLLAPRQIEGGKLLFAGPVKDDVPLPFVSRADFGRLVARMFENKNKYLRRRWLLASETATMKELVQYFAKVSGRPCSYQYIPGEQWLDLNPKKELLFDLMYIYAEGKREPDMAEWKRLLGSSTTLESAKHWVETNWGSAIKAKQVQAS